MESLEVRKELESLLRERGFREVGSNWRREREEVYQLAHIDRSSYSERFFLNLGIVFKKIHVGDAPYNTEGSHLTFRPGDGRGRKPSDPPSSMPFKGLVASALDSRQAWRDEERIAFINGPLWDDAEANFARYSTLERACELARLPREQRPLGQPLVHRALREYCGGHIDSPENAEGFGL